MGVVSFSQAQQIAEIARVWHFGRFAKQHVQFLWLWIDAWAQICLLNLYNVDWHLERRYGRVRCEMWVGLEGVEHIGPFELRLWNEANIASLWSKMVVRPMRFLGRTSRLRFSGSFFDSDASVSRWKYARFGCQFGCETNIGPFFMVIWWPWGSAKRDGRQILRNTGCYTTNYMRGAKSVVLGGFFLGPKRQQKALRYLKESRIKNNQWDRISFDDFYFVQKMVATLKCLMKKHTYILWW